MGVNEVPSQLQRLRRRIVERTRGDSKRAVSRGMDGVRLLCLQGHVNAAFLLCEIVDGWSYPVLCYLLCYLSLCTSVNFAYDSLFDLKIYCCLLCMHFTSSFAAEIKEDGTSGECSLGDWANIAEERHSLNTRLQTKSYDCSEGRRPNEYTYNKSIQPSFAERNIHGWKTTRKIRENCAPRKFAAIW